MSLFVLVKPQIEDGVDKCACKSVLQLTIVELLVSGMFLLSFYFLPNSIPVQTTTMTHDNDNIVCFFLHLHIEMSDEVGIEEEVSVLSRSPFLG